MPMHYTLSEMGKNGKRVEKLLSVAEGRKNALIIPHDYADPDAIAAAMGIKKLFMAKLGLPATIAFEGVVGRAENRALCDCLEIETIPAGKVRFENYDLITLVDCQPGIGNNSLPEDRRADIVIDHHPPEGNLEGASFVDIIEDGGSSSTIVTRYLVHAGVSIDSDLATALIYGIKTDAMNFFRKTGKADINAYLCLFPLADREKMNRIESARLPLEYFGSLRDAIENAGVYDNVLVSDLGDVFDPGLIGEFADLFLRLDDAMTVLCFGIYEGKLLISIRSLDPDVDAGKVIRYAVGKRGTAGGHAAMAGGQIPLTRDTRKEKREHMQAVLDRVFSRLGIEGKRKRGIT